MIKYSLSSVVAVLIFIAPAFSKEDFRTKRIAVLEFMASNIDDTYAKAARNRVEVELFKSNLHVIERRSLNRILTEMGIKMECRDDACAIKQGKMVSADYVVMGDVTYVGKYLITTRVVNVNTGKIVFADLVILKNKKDILRKTGFLAKRLSGVVDEEANPSRKEELHAPFSVGFLCYYAWFDPVWSQSKIKTAFDRQQIKLDMPIKADFLYNLYFIIRMSERWSLAPSYLYGRHLLSDKNYGFNIISGMGLKFNNSKHKREYLAERHEAQLFFNYKFNRRFILYFGPLYQGYRITMKIDVLLIEGVSGTFYPPKDFKIKPHLFAMGPAVGYTLKPYLGKGFYLTQSLRASFLAGKDLENPQISPVMSYLLVLYPTYRSKVFYYLNMKGSIGISYVIGKAHLAIEAGGSIEGSIYFEKPWRHLKQIYDLSYGPYLGVRYFM